MADSIHVRVGVSLRERLPELNDTELRVLFALGLRINKERQCWPSVDALAGECTRSPRQVQRAINTLLEKDFIWVGRRAGGRGKRTVYTLNGYFAYGPESEAVQPFLLKGDMGVGVSGEKSAQKGDISEQKGDISGKKGDISGKKGDMGVAKRVTPVSGKVRPTNLPADTDIMMKNNHRSITKGRRTKKEEPRKMEADRLHLGPETEASKYLFGKTGRKRWSNAIQKEEFEKAEAEVGFLRLKEAIDWALLSGISNIKSMVTAARKGKRGVPDQEKGKPKERGTRGRVTGSRPASDYRGKW